MYCTPNQIKGFSLIEVAVVLLVVGLLLSMILKPLGAGYDQSRRNQAQLQLEQIRDAVIGFAAANGRLPCPATVGSAGQEPETCANEHGYVPSAVLGISGNFNHSGMLLDPWNHPIHFSTSLADSSEAGTQGVADFINAEELRTVGMQHLRADLQICANSGDSCSRNQLRANRVPVVIYSLGKDTGKGGDQLENLDNDLIFTSREFSQASGKEFDDIVIWLSDNILFTRLMEAGILP